MSLADLGVVNPRPGRPKGSSKRRPGRPKAVAPKAPAKHRGRKPGAQGGGLLKGYVKVAAARRIAQVEVAKVMALLPKLVKRESKKQLK